MTNIVQESNGNCQPTHIHDACDMCYNILFIMPHLAICKVFMCKCARVLSMYNTYTKSHLGSQIGVVRDETWYQCEILLPLFEFWIENIYTICWFFLSWRTSIYIHICTWDCLLRVIVCFLWYLVGMMYDK